MIYTLSGSTIYPGVAFTHPDGRQFPRNWLTYTKAERDALGITEAAEPASYDGRFYTAVDTERDLAEVKAQYVGYEKVAAASILSRTDWYVTRKAEKDTAIPDSVVTHRDAVRAANVTREGQINGAASITTLKALIDASQTIQNSDGDLVNNPAALTPYPAN